MGIKGTILVVDDEPAIIEFLNMMLTDEGYNVLCAPNGMVALDMLAQHSPHLILLDIGMPIMNGPAFLHHYKHYLGRCGPVIIMTAVPEPTFEQALLECITQ